MAAARWRPEFRDLAARHPAASTSCRWGSRRRCARPTSSEGRGRGPARGAPRPAEPSETAQPARARDGLRRPLRRAVAAARVPRRGAGADPARDRRADPHQLPRRPRAVAALARRRRPVRPALRVAGRGLLRDGARHPTAPRAHARPAGRDGGRGGGGAVVPLPEGGALRQAPRPARARGRARRPEPAPPPLPRREPVARGRPRRSRPRGRASLPPPRAARPPFPRRRGDRLGAGPDPRHPAARAGLRDRAGPAAGRPHRGGRGPPVGAGGGGALLSAACRWRLPRR